MRDYPQDAVREALLNAIVHRDYSYSGSVLISIFDDRLEFVSLGGLPKGIAYSDLMLGVSVLRNSRLGNVFYRLHLIEAFGIGMPKIIDSYKDQKNKPLIEISENAFKITLSNTNFHRENSTEEVRLSDTEKSVLHYLSKHKNAARIEIEAEIGLSQSKTIRTLKTLSNKQLITVLGQGKNIRYSLSDV